MGEAGNGVLRLKFNRTLKLKFHGAKITSDAGLLAYRELDEQFGLTRAAAEELLDARRGENTRHSMLALFRHGIYGRLAGYQDTNDAERLRVDRAMLREANVHSARDWRMVLQPIAERYRTRRMEKFFRADAAFADPGLYRYLEQEGYRYAIRLPGNKLLYDAVQHLLKRPVGRPSREPKAFHASFRYQAASWEADRRVVAKVEWHLGELFPRVGFIVTNLRWWSKSVVAFYNQRGTAEQWIKKGKNAVKWTGLSCREFKDNQVRLRPFAFAHNLANFLRRLALPRAVRHCSLTTLKEKLVRIRAKVVKHSRYVIFQLAEVAVPRELFAAILGRIHRLAPAPT